MNPKISIVTITFNSEKTLEETILSVISQDYDNLEYIIVDGASTDGTLEIAGKYRDKITTLVSEPDKGISDAFNKGIALATGEIVGIINSDDLLLPGALANIARAYEEGVGVYRGNTIVFDDTTGTRIRMVPGMSFPANSLSIGNICHQSTFVAKAAYTEYGSFRISLRFMMDADLLIRMYENKVKFKYVDSDLAVSRIGGVTDRHSFWEKKGEVYDIIVANGGSRLFALLRTVKFCLYQFVKSVCFKFGADRARRLRYRKSVV